jgi:hypothetical protein
MRSYGYTRGYPGTRPQPRAIFHHDWFNDEIKRGHAMVMIAGAEERTLGNAHIVTDDKAVQVQKPTLLAEPNVVSDFEFPWEGDLYLRFNNNSRSDTSAKGTKNAPLDGG